MNTIRLYRSGQVTLFILLGVMLLGGVALYFVMSSSPSERIEPVEQVPVEFEAVATYVEQCVSKVSLEALRRAGAQGGYIDPQSWGLTYSMFDATEGDMVEFAPGSNIFLPYWYHMAQPNSCIEQCYFSSKQPPLVGGHSMSVQRQVENYVNRNVGACLDGFRPLFEQGYTVTAPNIWSAQVHFNRNDVRVVLEYPITVEREDVFAQLERFVVMHDIPFLRMYEYATIIAASQEQFRFLERHTIEMISVFSGVDRNKLPPFSATEFNFVSTMFWLRSQVYDQLQSMLMSYVQGLQVRNSANYAPRRYTGTGSAAPAVQRLFDNMVLPIENPGFDDLHVTFEYLGWPMYFDINSRGEVIQPDSMSIDLFPFFGIQQYNNQYDISYPVRVTVRDPRALQGDGFILSMALEANIRTNEEMLPDFDGIASTAPYAADFDVGNFCDIRHRNSGIISFDLVDGVEGQSVDNAQVQMICGDLSCAVGAVNQGQFAEYLPICSGGVLLINKQDFVTTRIPLSPQLDEDMDLGQVVLEPYRERKIELKKIPLFKQGNRWELSADQLHDVSPSEMAIIQFTQVVPFDDMQPHTAVAVIGEDDQDVVRLIPGVYELKVNIIDRQGLVVPPDRRRVSTGLFGSRTFSVPEQPLELDQFISGGFSANAQTGYITIYKSDLDSADTIVIHALGIEFPWNIKVEDLDIMGRIDEFSLQYRSQLGIRYRQGGMS